MARLGSMRWERLFADLEAQLEGELRRDLDAEVAARTAARARQQAESGAFRQARGDNSGDVTIQGKIAYMSPEQGIARLDDSDSGMPPACLLATGPLSRSRTSPVPVVRARSTAWGRTSSIWPSMPVVRSVGRSTSWVAGRCTSRPS